MPRNLSESEAIADFVTLLLYWFTTYVSSVLAEKTRLSPLLFWLFFGCVYGNVGLVSHSEVIHFIAELAITIVFFALGFEENVTHFLHGIKKAWGIASIGAIVPFICGLTSAMLFWPDSRWEAQMMVGLAVTATAVSLTMISLKSEGLALSKAAIGIMTSAVLDDVAALALVAIMVPICTGEAEPTAPGILWVFSKSIIFFVLVAILNMFIFPVVRKIEDIEKYKILNMMPGVRSIGIHFFVRFNHGEQATLSAFIVALSVGLLAAAFGFHPCIGAYMAGLILEERYFDIELDDEDDDLDPMVSNGQNHANGQDGAGMSEGELGVPDWEESEERWTNVFHHVKDIIEDAAFCWIGPIFFLNMGAQIKIRADLLGLCIGPAIAIYFYLGIGQIISAAVAARYVPGGFTWAESWMIGIGMLGRAELFFVVLNLAYLTNPIISEEMFFTLTLSAMMLNITVPIAIAWYKPYYMGIKGLFLRPSSGQGALVKHDDQSKVSVVAFKRLLDKATEDDRAAQRRMFKVKTDVSNVVPAKKRGSVDAGDGDKPTNGHRTSLTAELITVPRAASKEWTDARRSMSKEERRGSKENMPESGFQRRSSSKEVDALLKRRSSTVSVNGGSSRFVQQQWTDIELEEHIVAVAPPANPPAKKDDPNAVAVQVEKEQKTSLEIVPNSVPPPPAPTQAWGDGKEGPAKV